MTSHASTSVSAHRGCYPDESSEELGLRYVRLPSKFEPNLFIIKMQHVVKQNNVLDVRDIALYYVNLGVMYQAPNVRSLVMARMQNCADRIKKRRLIFFKAASSLILLGIVFV